MCFKAAPGTKYQKCGHRVEGVEKEYKCKDYPNYDSGPLQLPQTQTLLSSHQPRGEETRLKRRYCLREKEDGPFFTL
jgi:hypothetical protein